MGRGLAHKRHQQEKAKKRAREKLVNQWNWTPPDGDFEPDHRQIAMHATTPKLCSCYMCGNRRKHEGPPVSEKKYTESDLVW